MQNLCKLDQNTLSNLQYYMPQNYVLRQLADVFSLFSDETRLKILSALSISPMCVGDISKYLNINQTTVSHQLKFLKNHNFVRDERMGKSVFYSLATDFVSDILSSAVDFILN